MTEWWRGAVIYQIYPRSYNDANGDGIGDLPGITAKLEYIASLGVDGIWLSPFFTSPMKDFGYDVADYRGIDPMFGTLADFDAMVARAHELGLKVIIDQVYSHTSDQHPWFQESRTSRTNAKADWYVWVDPKPDGAAPNNWLSVFGGVSWEWEPRRRQFYLHNFLKEQPDLNFHNPEVQAEILDVARFWLDRGVDGFRLDTANFYMHDPLLRSNPPRTLPQVPVNPYEMQEHVYDRSRPENIGFIRDLRAVLDGYDARMTVGEIGSFNFLPRMIEYTEGDDRLHTGYSFVFLRRDFGAHLIRRTMEEMETKAPGAWPSWSFSNHDVPRVVSRWMGESHNPAKAALFNALLLCLRGTAFLYQGEELGLPEADVPYEALQDPVGKTFWPDDKGRDGCRTPMPWKQDNAHAGFTTGTPWLPVDPRHLPLAVGAQQNHAGSPLNLLRQFINWRKDQPALKWGETYFLDVDEPALAFERKWQGQRLLCVFNLSPTAIAADLPLDGAPLHVQHHGLGGTLTGTRVELPAWGAVFATLS